MTEPSGAPWCARYPGSRDVVDLASPFRERAAAFIDALRNAGAAVSISATYRPPERAYLMHWCCLAAGYRDKAGLFHQVAPADVPPMPGIEIDWTHGGDVGAARAAAVAMRQGYNIAFPAVLVSRHTQHRAVDMTIHWAGTITVRDALGIEHSVSTQEQLWPIGTSFGVIKLASDPPHWSDDGH